MRRPLERRRCRECGTAFAIYHRQGGGMVYCSARCKQRWDDRLYHARRDHRPEAGQLRHVACPWCGRRFTTTHPRKVYCSTTCKRKTDTARQELGYYKHSAYVKPATEPGESWFCGCGHKLTPLDFTTDHLGRVRQHCTHCGQEMAA